MTRQEAVDEIIDTLRLVDSTHPYKDDILFFKMLETAAVKKQWFEVCDFCVIRIKHLENKQNLNNLNQDIKDLKDKI
jgi:hypothetical protein